MFRIGIGYDVHRLVAGRLLVLGGVEIAHDRGLAGHSDADALLHALIDALLGAAALGDIGGHFPPGDDRWRDADSAALLTVVLAELTAAGWRVGNVDANLIAERPRLMPYITAIRTRIAALLGVDVDRVSVKAKTNEGLDAVGAGDAIAAQVVVLVERV